jgi:FkbM family methyltransferase
MSLRKSIYGKIKRRIKTTLELFEPVWIRMRFREKNDLQSIRYKSFLITETKHDPYVRRIAFNRTEGDEQMWKRVGLLLKDIQNPVILDVGANIGFVSLLLSEIKGATIYSFEPVTRTYACLRRNLEQNRIHNVTPINMGLSDQEGEFFIGPPSGDQHPRYRRDNLKTGLYSVYASTNSEGAKKFGEMARFTTLDNWMHREKLATVHYLKIDVEGHEPNVLQGARETLAKTRPICQLEFNPMTLQIARKKVSDFFGIFEQMDYVASYFDGLTFRKVSLEESMSRIMEIYAFPTNGSSSTPSR